MLAELLSFPPRSFIFREPRLPQGQPRLKPETPQLLAETGLDAMRLSEEMSALDPDAAVEHFRDTINTAATTLEVVGVKEIRHEYVSRMSRVFPNMRVIMTIRDPRDIFLSMFHKRDRLEARGKKWHDPTTLAADLNAEFSRILELMSRHEYLIVPYEDLVTDAAVVDTVRRFAGIRGDGESLLGRTSAFNRDKHGYEIRSTRLALWKSEPTGEGMDSMMRFQALVPDYAEFHASHTVRGAGTG